MQRHAAVASPFAALYAALIVYASLYPFAGWRLPTVNLATFLLQPWPRYWTAFDLVSNAVGYVPLGLLVGLVLCGRGWRAWRAALGAALAGAALSLALELLQHFVPGRVPSNVDLGLNTLGAAVGGGLALVVHARGGVARLERFRDRWFTRRSAGGIVLLIVWPIGLLFPLPLPLGVGQVIARGRDALYEALQDTWAADWAEQWLAEPLNASGLGPGGEWLVVAFGMLAPCLVGYAVTSAGWRRHALVAVLVAAAAVTTTLSTALNFGPQHALAWATPRALAAIVVAVAVAAVLVRLPRRAAAAVGLMVLTALVVLVTQAPDDPYFAQTLQSWEQGRFIRFHGAAQWVGWLWPYAAIAHLLAMVGLRRERAPDEAHLKMPS